MLREQELGQLLRRMPEQDRYDLVQWVISQSVEIGLSLVRKCINRPKHLGAILLRGMEEAEEEEIRLWLYCVLGPFGFGPMKKTKLFHMLNEAVTTHRKAVENILRYLPEFIGRNSTYGHAQYAILVRRTYRQAQRDGEVNEWLAQKYANPISRNCGASLDEDIIS